MNKVCSKCKTIQPLEFFHNSKKGDKNGKVSVCKPCRKEEARIRYSKDLQTNRYKNRVSHYKNKYGIVPETYETMKLNQNSKCAICQQYYYLFRLDHDHSTGKIRGLLCHNCNVGLGHFKDNIELLNKAIGYLNAYSN